MLSWAFAFLVIALMAAVLGFAGLAGFASAVAQFLCLVFLALFAGAMLLHGGRRV